MDGILLINKDKNITSRDVVNKVCKLLNTKKIGHTGTLDPIATGVLVLCIGKYTKLVDIITSYEKEYIATALLGVDYDTLDITGNIIKKEEVDININQIKEVLNTFIGKYIQEVPIYSAVKINGKRLYEYARSNEEIILSDEHKSMKWMTYEEAITKLKFDSNKTALWELNEKLKRRKIIE